MASYELNCAQEANKPSMDKAVQNLPIFAFMAE
jgi:hypothetical protein